MVQGGLRWCRGGLTALGCTPRKSKNQLLVFVLAFCCRSRPTSCAAFFISLDILILCIPV